MRFLLRTFLDMLFPRFCIRCKREGSYICQDCAALIDINEHRYCLCTPPVRISGQSSCRVCAEQPLDGIFSALSCEDTLVRKLLRSFRNEPFLKDSIPELVSFIVIHFTLLDKKFSNRDTLLIPIPMTKKRIGYRGYNQSQEIARHLSSRIHVPFASDVLVRTRDAIPHTGLAREKRKENIKRCFHVREPEYIKEKTIFLVDDIYETGSTMKEVAKTLKEAGATHVFGITLARG